MALHRRTVLQVAGTAGLASLAGCSAIADLLSQEQYDYTLTVDAVDTSPIEHALYEPDGDDELFTTAARDALDAILPSGRHTTYGFEPLPAGAYVEHEGRYFQTTTVVTGRERMERTLVRVHPVDERTLDADPRPADSLPAASARVVKLLHEHAAGSGSGTDLLRGDAYVLRRPTELNGPIAGDLAGEVVAIADRGHWAYRVALATETITEPVYETFAVEVAADREAFHEVVLATRTDADLDQVTLEPEVRHLLEDAIDSDVYRETTPLSPPFQRLLDRLGLESVDVGKGGLLLWYDESLYRYGLYVNPAS